MKLAGILAPLPNYTQMGAGHLQSVYVRRTSIPFKTILCGKAGKAAPGMQMQWFSCKGCHYSFRSSKTKGGFLNLFLYFKRNWFENYRGAPGKETCQTADK